jgi:hypothetical protein
MIGKIPVVVHFWGPFATVPRSLNCSQLLLMELDVWCGGAPTLWVLYITVPFLPVYSHLILLSRNINAYKLIRRRREEIFFGSFLESVGCRPYVWGPSSLLTN